jgi:hypothetical protein
MSHAETTANARARPVAQMLRAFFRGRAQRLTPKRTSIIPITISWGSSCAEYGTFRAAIATSKHPNMYPGALAAASGNFMFLVSLESVTTAPHDREFSAVGIYICAFDQLACIWWRWKRRAGLIIPAHGRRPHAWDESHCHLATYPYYTIVCNAGANSAGPRSRNQRENMRLAIPGVAAFRKTEVPQCLGPHSFAGRISDRRWRENRQDCEEGRNKKRLHSVDLASGSCW